MRWISNGNRRGVGDAVANLKRTWFAVNLYLRVDDRLEPARNLRHALASNVKITPSSFSRSPYTHRHSRFQGACVRQWIDGLILSLQAQCQLTVCHLILFSASQLTKDVPIRDKGTTACSGEHGLLPARPTTTH